MIVAAMRSLGSSAAMLLMGQVLHRGANLLFLAVLANVGAAAELQFFVLLMAYSGVVHLQSALFYAYAARHPQLSANVGLVAWLALLSAVALAVPMTALLMWTSSALLASQPWWVGWVVVPLAVVSAAMQDFSIAALVALGEFRRAVLGQAGFATAMLLCTLVVLVSPPSAFAALLVIVLLSGIWAGILFIQRQWQPMAKARWQPSVTRRWLHYSLPLVASSLLLVPLVTTVVAAVPGLSLQDRVGLFVAQNWLGLVMVIPGGLSSASFAFLLGAQQERKPLNTAYVLLNLIYVTAALAVVSLVLPAISHLYGPSADALLQAAPILIFAAVPLSLFQIVSNNLLSLGRTRAVLLGDTAFAAAVLSAFALAILHRLDLVSFCIVLVGAHALRLAVGVLALTSPQRHFAETRR